MTEKIGPVQLVAIGFPPDAEFEGRIMDELERLESHETIRILDLLFVGKDAETGDLLALDYQGEESGRDRRRAAWLRFRGRASNRTGHRKIQGHAFGLSQREIHGHGGLAAPWRAPPASSSSSTCGRAI